MSETPAISSVRPYSLAVLPFEKPTFCAFVGVYGPDQDAFRNRV